MLTYRIREGNSQDTLNPAFILVHGYGSHADDLFSFSPYLPKSHTIIALQAPLSIGFGGFAWYPLHFNTDGTLHSEVEDAWKAVDLIVKTVEELIHLHRLNPADISYLGFSQGAILGWALAFHHPKKIRRLIALSGFIHESVNIDLTPTFTAFASHGIKDEVISIELVRASLNSVLTRYPDIEYHEYEEGHTVTQKNFTDLLLWIEKTKMG